MSAEIDRIQDAIDDLDAEEDDIEDLEDLDRRLEKAEQGFSDVIGDLRALGLSTSDIRALGVDME